MTVSVARNVAAPKPVAPAPEAPRAPQTPAAPLNHPFYGSPTLGQSAIEPGKKFQFPLTGAGFDKALASATRDQKLEMLKTLLGPSSSKLVALDASAAPVAIQESILKLLSSAKDLHEFDWLYSRVNDSRLRKAVSGDHQQQLDGLIAKHWGTVRPGDWAQFQSYLRDVSEAVKCAPSAFDFLVDGKNFLPALEQAINGAEKSIHISIFQFQPDETGNHIVDLLINKAKQGVKVRLMVDEHGTQGGPLIAGKAISMLNRLRLTPNAEVVVNKSDALKNHLDHRKILTFDGKLAFTGGMNLGDHYQKHWHDQQTLIQGPAVAELQKAFLNQWEAQGGTVPTRTEHAELFPKLAPVPNGFESWIVKHEGNGKDRNIKAAYLRAIATAQKSITLATPYFCDEEVVQGLCAAAKRGVVVRCLFPRDNNQRVVVAAQKAFYEEMLAAKSPDGKGRIEIYEWVGDGSYKESMAHQKVATIDGIFTTAGSSNLDPRSTVFNDELNYVILDPRFAKEVENEMFNVDLQHAERIHKGPPGGALKRWLWGQVFAEIL